MYGERYHVEFRHSLQLDGTDLFVFRYAGREAPSMLASNGEWYECSQEVMPQSTLFLPQDSKKALVTAVLTDAYGALPHDQLLRDRLDIETGRVDKLLEKLVS